MNKYFKAVQIFFLNIQTGRNNKNYNRTDEHLLPSKATAKKKKDYEVFCVVVVINSSPLICFCRKEQSNMNECYVTI